MRSQRRNNPSMMLFVGFFTTVTVAFVRSSISVSELLRAPAETSARVEVPVLIESSEDGDPFAARTIEDGSSGPESLPLAVEVVAGSNLVCSLVEELESRGPSFCEGSGGLAMPLDCCSSTLGFLISRSFNDSITASMNIWKFFGKTKCVKVSSSDDWRLFQSERNWGVLDNTLFHGICKLIPSFQSLL